MNGTTPGWQQGDPRGYVPYTAYSPYAPHTPYYPHPYAPYSPYVPQHPYHPSHYAPWLLYSYLYPLAHPYDRGWAAQGGVQGQSGYDALYFTPAAPSEAAGAPWPAAGSRGY